MTEQHIGRLLTALGVSFLIVGVALGMEAWLSNHPEHAMPELTKIGGALLLASLVFGRLNEAARKRGNV